MGGGLLAIVFPFEQREAEFERAELGDGETHRPTEVVGPHRHLLAIDQHRHALDIATGIVEAIGQRLQVGRQLRHRNLALRGEVLEAMGVTLGEAWQHRHQAAEGRGSGGHSTSSAASVRSTSSR
jgi:hypothetical protein